LRTTVPGLSLTFPPISPFCFSEIERSVTCLPHTSSLERNRCAVLPPCIRIRLVSESHASFLFFYIFCRRYPSRLFLSREPRLKSLPFPFDLSVRSWNQRKDHFSPFPPTPFDLQIGRRGHVSLSFPPKTLQSLLLTSAISAAAFQRIFLLPSNYTSAESIPTTRVFSRDFYKEMFSTFFRLTA